MTNQRRVHPRVRVSFEVTWRTVWVQIPTSSRISDLSVGGCLIEGSGQHAPGKPLHLELKLPHEDRLSVNVEVVHSCPNQGFGVRFLDLTSENQEALSRAVEDQLGQPSSAA